MGLGTGVVLGTRCAMMIVDSLQMSAAVFKAELRARGFQIRRRRVCDVSGVCPGFAIMAVLRRGQIDRVATLARAVAARQEEVAERRARADGGPI
jgi:hypothetical protein